MCCAFEQDIFEQIEKCKVENPTWSSTAAKEILRSAMASTTRLLRNVQVTSSTSAAQSCSSDGPTVSLSALALAGQFAEQGMQPSLPALAAQVVAAPEDPGAMETFAPGNQDQPALAAQVVAAPFAMATFVPSTQDQPKMLDDDAELASLEARLDILRKEKNDRALNKIAEDACMAAAVGGF
jgi:hypothetical protein